MDPRTGQRRQNDSPMHTSSNPRYQQTLHDQQQRRSYAGNPGERGGYRSTPAPLNTSSAAASRSMSSSASYGGYYQEPAGSTFSAGAIPQSTMGYHQSATDYGQADARQTQGFTTSTYNPMMYNVQQAAGTQNATVYDANSQFSRQPAALQMMSTDVAAPYFQSEPTNPAAAAASAIQQSTATSSTSQGVYQQPGLPSYSSGSMATIGAMAAASQSSAAADVSMEEDYPPAGGLDEAYTSYQTALKEIFQNIRSGILAAASESLLNVSDWLLSHVAELGLTSDDQNLHQDRIKLWNDFNHAWLALFQRQKDLIESGQQLQRSQSLITRDSLEKMGKELVRLCDGIERHGLVDYQYGVWEEQIIAILEECLDLGDAQDEAGGSTAASASQQR
ncbi:hypothetical protein GQ53DRAFT_783478 [Thozetella sp. PMI_491]|nr:hypothetical protein GQ53DRAFT_783478 [Thozetella sp. PMI_491]